MTLSENNALRALIKKYETFIGNIEWHIRTNSQEVSEATEKQLECYKEIVKDLKLFVK